MLMTEVVVKREALFVGDAAIAGSRIGRNSIYCRRWLLVGLAGRRGEPWDWGASRCVVVLSFGLYFLAGKM